MGKLTQEEIEEYFVIHLPYRNRILVHHKEICDRGPYREDSILFNASFEASLIVGRMYLMFMGVYRNKTTLKRHNFREDDISCMDPGGRIVDIDALTEQDQDLLFRFLRTADKATAHLTKPFKSDYPITNEAITKIVELLKTNLYSVTGRTFNC